MAKNSEENIRELEKLYERPDYLKELKGDNIWLKIGHLVTDQVNLSFGYPDFISYPEMSDAYREALATEGHHLHQYARLVGHTRLVNALAKYYQIQFDREIDPMTEIITTPGTDYGIFVTLNSILAEGDEVIVFEPVYTFYHMIPKLRGAKIVYVPLKTKPDAHKKGYTTSADWVWDDTQLEAAFNPKTKAIVICTPSNPLGKVMSPEELEKIASLCIKYNVVCISDEVYHQMVYDENLKHTSIATLPGMWERTLTIASSGKLFSNTGLKIGWVIGDKRLVHNCTRIYLITIIAVSTLNQEVVAICFEKEIQRLNSPECYFHRIKPEAKQKRDFLVKQLVEIGLEPVVPEAGYFIIADISKLAAKLDLSDDEPDLPLNIKFVKYMIKKGVVFFPCTPFFSENNKECQENYIRICFYKKDETLQQAVEAFKQIKLE